MTKATENWIEICSLDEIPPSQARTVNIGNASIAVFRLSDDRIKALENRCPHKNGPLAEGIISGDDVLCPLHNWRIHLEDGQVAAPDQGCVKTYSTKIEHGIVFLDLE
ncbi:MAG: nitrite reductase small subunit NirD [Mariprofundaceae bacterium]|nr:nitrite reductase small subunit NirD [Mariprofundaceae bacterium]